MKKTIINNPEMTDEEFLDRVFSKSESVSSVNTSKTALTIFDQYCQHEIGLNESQSQMILVNIKHDISQYQTWLRPVRDE